MTDESWHALLFGIRKSVRYHERRAAFFLSLDRINGIVSLSAGAGAVSSALSARPDLAAVAGGIVAVSNIINVVVGSSRMAALHRELRGRFIDLERRVQRAPKTEEALQECTDERLRIEQEEPPIVGALEMLCYNEEARAEGNFEHVRRMDWLHKLLCQVLDYEPKDRPA